MARVNKVKTKVVPRFAASNTFRLVQYPDKVHNKGPNVFDTISMSGLEEGPVVNRSRRKRVPRLGRRDWDYLVFILTERGGVSSRLRKLQTGSPSLSNVKFKVRPLRWWVTGKTSKSPLVRPLVGLDYGPSVLKTGPPRSLGRRRSFAARHAN